jgi:hypothetical protein
MRPFIKRDYNDRVSIVTVPPGAGRPGQQLFWLLVLAIPIACVARTVVFEEVFREMREWCSNRGKDCDRLLQRKFYYLFTCEYCFSHYVTIAFLLLTRFRLLLDDWRGYVISFFALVFVANAYMNLYNRLRVDITQAKTETKRIEKEVENAPSQSARDSHAAG